LLNHGFEIVISQTVQNHEEIHVSGGELGVNIRLSSHDLVDLTRAKVADIC
jgi:prolyl-tRNA editing enzyme YbaK/EbsC (Cys-tRNA(Pro) deacylase)